MILGVAALWKYPKFGLQCGIRSAAKNLYPFLQQTFLIVSKDFFFHPIHSCRLVSHKTKQRQLVLTCLFHVEYNVRKSLPGLLCFPSPLPTKVSQCLTSAIKRYPPALVGKQPARVRVGEYWIRVISSGALAWPPRLR